MHFGGGFVDKDQLVFQVRTNTQDSNDDRARTITMPRKESETVLGVRLDTEMRTHVGLQFSFRKAKGAFSEMPSITSQ